MKLVCNSCDGKYNSVDVRFTKSCDNNCSFCIEKNGLLSLGEPNVEEMAKSVLKTGIKDVLILGGEPLLYIDRVLNFVNLIREHVDTIYITTSLPRTIVQNWKNFEKIMETIDGLNVSIQHYDPKINNDILRANNRHDRIELLRQINIRHSSKVRTSINLVKGSIDTKEKLLKTLSKLEFNGCSNFKINELQDSSEYVSYEEIMKETLPNPYSNGCQTKIKIENIQASVLLKRSCFAVEKTKKANIFDLIKVISRMFYKKSNIFRVVYENGYINKGWGKC